MDRPSKLLKMVLFEFIVSTIVVYTALYTYPDLYFARQHRLQFGNTTAINNHSVLLENGTLIDVLSACRIAVLNVTEAVNEELAKSIRLSSGVALFGPFSDDLCAPYIENIGCNQLGITALPCERVYRLEIFNHNYQYHCLFKLVQQIHKKKSTTLVPRILHVASYYGAKSFRFRHYIGLLSIVRQFKPEVVFFWNNGLLPTGRWWYELLSHFDQNRTGNSTVYEFFTDGYEDSTISRKVEFFKTKLISVVRDSPSQIYDTPVSTAEQKSDIVRLEAALLYGGMSADLDVIALRSLELDEFLNAPVTMGRDGPEAPVEKAIMFADRLADHLYLLHHSYTTYKAYQWTAHSMVTNRGLHAKCPHLLHMEERKLILPASTTPQLYQVGSQFNLTNVHTLHAWVRKMPLEPDPGLIVLWKTPLGGVLRDLYYGRSEIWQGEVSADLWNKQLYLVACSNLVRDAINFVHQEIRRAFKAKGNSKCEPTLKRTPCQDAHSSLPCVNNATIEEFFFSTQHQCLLDIAQAVAAKNPKEVPRALHIIWFYRANTKFKFHHYLSVLSILKFFEPEVIFLWNDGRLPSGNWWLELMGHLNKPKKSSSVVTEHYNVSGQVFSINRTVESYRTRIISVVRAIPNTIYGTRVIRPEHYSEIVRLEALLLYGGMYADLDIIAIRSLLPLLNFSATMGRDAPKSISTGVIFARPGSGHLYLLHRSYQTFKTLEWNQHSMTGNHDVHAMCPNFMKVEDGTLIVPNYQASRQLFSTKQLIDLSTAYSIHIWWRHMPFEPDPMTIQSRNCTASIVMRSVYLGT